MTRRQALLWAYDILENSLDVPEMTTTDDCEIIENEVLPVIEAMIEEEKE